ncbi:hypothetical protein KIW84_023851 [Lathyrus oleraceus]|uniref:Reverse transcriptase zinc-binding domain-containing protein n=1 Tax=Pisum sativum TaxID=3888 RepID=A0A9D5BC93_PEA|nr:hypothetical protein KIW84_023851 [Pisum sativum]
MNKKLDLEVSWVVWDTISKLGISSNMRQEGNVDDIENMERRRREGKQNLEVNWKSLLLNIIGGGSIIKRKGVSYLVQSGTFEICLLQETKIKNFDYNFACEFLGNMEVEWSSCDSVGASGGMVILWKKNIFMLNYNFRGEGFMGINMEWRGSNIYASCNVLIRRSMRIDLIKGRLSSEVKGRASEMEEFHGFIGDMKLTNMSYIGGRFIWFNGSGNAMNRLDKFLLSDNLISLWKITTKWIGQRDISYHCLIWLKSCSSDWGPKPFRFKNCWFKNVDIVKFVKEEWIKLEVNGRGDYRLSEKLKSL